MTRANFDPLSLFPSEGVAIADAHSEGAYPGVHARNPAPIPTGQAAVNEANECEALEDLRDQLCQTVAAIQESLLEASALRTDLHQVRALAVQLTQDYDSIKEASRQARESSGTAMAAIQGLEQRLAACEPLAADFAHWALESRKRPAERPPVDASRLPVLRRTTASQSSKLLARTIESVRTTARSSGSLLTRLPSWAVDHRADLLAGVGVLVLVSLMLIGVGDVGRTSEQPAPPIPSGSIPWTPTMMLVGAGTGTPLGQHLREGALEAPQVRARQFMGTLAVASDPLGAAVFVDRRLVGTTPLRMPRLSAGSHAVWVELTGYERWTAAILVPADKLTEVSVRLRREAQVHVGELAKAP